MPKGGYMSHHLQAPANFLLELEPCSSVPAGVNFPSWQCYRLLICNPETTTLSQPHPNARDSSRSPGGTHISMLHLLIPHRSQRFRIALGTVRAKISGNGAALSLWPRGAHIICASHASFRLARAQQTRGTWTAATFRVFRWVAAKDQSV